MTHVVQPTKASCGPAVIAMLVGTDVEDVIYTLRNVRTGARTRIRNERSNVGELARILKTYGKRLGRRLRDTLPSTGQAILRVQHERGTNWHWLALDNGTVYDPLGETMTIPELYARYAVNRVSYYEVESL